jgi:AsmA protein
MNKAVKWIIGVLAALVGLLIIIALSLPRLIDPNDYKTVIARKVQEQTGRELSIPGDIELDVSLLGLQTMFSLGDVQLSSSPDFPETAFLSSRQVQVELALWPLIRNKELQVSNIHLEGVNVNLVRNEDGSSNWDDLAGKPEAEPAAPGREERPSGKKAGPGLAGLDIGGVLIKDINVSLEDRQTGRSIKLSDFNLEAGHIREGKNFPLAADFVLSLDDGKEKTLIARIDAGTNLTFNLDRQHFIASGFALDAILRGGALPVPKLALGLAGDLDLDLGRQKIEVKNLVISQEDLRLDASLLVDGLAAPNVSGTVNIAQFSPRARAESLGFALPFEDPRSLTSMAAGIDFTLDPTKLTISRLLLNVDQTTAEGTAAVTGLTGKPAYELTVHVDQVDLDRYKMKKTTETASQATSPPAAPSASPAAAAAEAPLIPVELLRGLNFRADITVDKLKAAKMNMAGIALKASGQNGLIKLEPLSAGLYGGTINVSADLDSRPAVPTARVAKTLKGVQLGPMLRDMTGKEEVKGRADITADITTSGLTRQELTRNANGTMNLALADGEIAKLKIIDTIRTARTLIGSKDISAVLQQQAAQQTSGRPTSFAALTGSGVITNGVFHNNDLVAESELLKATGKGTVDLVNERIDYLLTIYLAKTIDRDQETGLVDLADTPIPYRVKGTFDNIEQSAALEEIVKSGAKKALFRELEKQLGGDKTEEGTKKEPADGARDLIDRGLRGIFGK